MCVCPKRRGTAKEPNARSDRRRKREVEEGGTGGGGPDREGEAGCVLVVDEIDGIACPAFNGASPQEEGVRSPPRVVQSR